jgi:hypothetical protein
MGDQPEMDSFGAGGAGGHAPFGLPKGAKPLKNPFTMSDTTQMVPPPGEIAEWEPDAHMVG